jgi:hypothetical protein
VFIIGQFHAPPVEEVFSVNHRTIDNSPAANPA